jgi:hypothetical protein
LAPASSKHKNYENKYTNIIAIIKGYVFIVYFGIMVITFIIFWKNLILSLFIPLFFLQNSKKRKKRREGGADWGFWPNWVTNDQAPPMIRL